MQAIPPHMKHSGTMNPPIYNTNPPKANALATTDSTIKINKFFRSFDGNTKASLIISITFIFYHPFNIFIDTL